MIQLDIAGSNNKLYRPRKTGNVSIVDSRQLPATFLSLKHYFLDVSAWNSTFTKSRVGISTVISMEQKDVWWFGTAFYVE